MKLELDFALNRAQRARRVQLAVASLGLVLGVQVGVCAWRYQAAVTSLQEHEDAMHALRQPVQGATSTSAASAEVVTQVREMIDSLAFPWDAVLAAMEKARVPDVVVDAMEQRAPQRTQNSHAQDQRAQEIGHRVILRVHAPDIGSVLEWLHRLEGQPVLRRVSLVSESLREQGRIDAVVDAMCVPGLASQPGLPGLVLQ
ncbi:hypothetical protein [Candidatus Symbiobacter mobilis]|uniref:Uncharacterized protein n=1 Tax=Candidatus Symbiobacter mobilis CR TaxID=946483 RepID=U5N7C0_9BURK|nr:hypothetical protein [Candidatus Symbiobacter mobilis]AGX87205.1 hypothetical protein Cenrod_1112 [Candidatus Symbiobacter mobilis CR]